MALIYTTQVDFENYVEGWVTDNSAALLRLLERAQRDIDAILGPIPRTTLTSTGLKLDPTKLADWEAAALSRCVCAQAEFRFTVGDEQLVAGRLTSRVIGPDFTEFYADADGENRNTGRYGRKVAIELEPIRHLRHLSGFVR